jgi:hypothetical protein
MGFEAPDRGEAIGRLSKLSMRLRRAFHPDGVARR